MIHVHQIFYEVGKMSSGPQRHEAGDFVKIIPFVHCHRCHGIRQCRVAREYPDETVLFDHWKRSNFTVWQRLSGAQVWNTHAATGAIELPAMISTLYLVVFHPAVA